MSDPLARLQTWFASQCDGDWEHEDRVRIATLDNPGWRVTINLAETHLAGRTFHAIEHGLADEASTDWHWIAVKDGHFEGAGDPSKLHIILRTFLDWAESSGR